MIKNHANQHSNYFLFRKIYNHTSLNMFKIFSLKNLIINLKISWAWARKYFSKFHWRKISPKLLWFLPKIQSYEFLTWVSKIILQIFSVSLLLASGVFIVYVIAVKKSKPSLILFNQFFFQFIFWFLNFWVCRLKKVGFIMCSV